MAIGKTWQSADRATYASVVLLPSVETFCSGIFLVFSFAENKHAGAAVHNEQWTMGIAI